MWVDGGYWLTAETKCPRDLLRPASGPRFASERRLVNQDLNFRFYHILILAVLCMPSGYILCLTACKESSFEQKHIIFSSDQRVSLGQGTKKQSTRANGHFCCDHDDLLSSPHAEIWAENEQVRRPSYSYATGLSVLTRLPNSLQFWVLDCHSSHGTFLDNHQFNSGEKRVITTGAVLVCHPPTFR